MDAMFWGLLLAKKHGLSGTAALKAAMITRALGTSPAAILLANELIARDAPKPADFRKPAASSQARTFDAEPIDTGSRVS